MSEEAMLTLMAENRRLRVINKAQDETITGLIEKWEHGASAQIDGMGDEIDRLKRVVSRLEDQVVYDDWLRNQLSSILSRVAIALKGPEPELMLWSWHDLPELAEKIKKRVDSLETAIKDFLCECALVEKLRKYETYQITTGSMDELRKAVD